MKILGSFLIASVPFALVACGPNNTTSDTSTSTTTAATSTTGAGGSGTCTGMPAPSGITLLAPDDGSSTYSTAMTTDENGYPLMAWVVADPHETAGATFFSRWDGCAWTAPESVDSGFDGNSYSSGEQEIAIAYDSSTTTIGIAYQVLNTSTANGDEGIRLATRTKNGSAWTVERVDDHDVAQVGGRNGVALGMAQGKIYVAWAENFVLCGTSGCGDVIERTKANGAWTAQVNAPGDPVYDITGNQIAMAIDPSGAPVIAFLESLHDEPYTGYAKVWRLGAPTVETAATGTLTGDGIALAFEGTKIDLLTETAPAGDTSGALWWYLQSGAAGTWSTPIAPPEDGGEIFGDFGSISVDGKGGIDAVISDDGGQSANPVCGEPKISTSADGVSFSTCGVALSTYTGFTTGLTSAFAPDGKIQIGFVGSESTTNGVLFYRAP